MASNLRVLTHSIPKGDLPAIRPVNRAAGNLPGALTRFIGREHDLAHLEQLLEEERLITIAGPGGMGKTRLALEVAKQSAYSFADGAWFADLARIDAPDLLPVAVGGGILGGKGPAPRDLDELIGALRDKALLIILDNCEHLIDRVAEFTETLLHGCQEIFVIATSREPLDIAGERVWRLAPMTSPPPDDRPTAAEVTEYESVRLFVDRATAVRADFTLDDATAPVVAEICRRLDGLPLAIQLAAARLKSLSPQQVLSRLDDRLEFLAGSGRTTVSRHKTLEAALGWSYDLLSPSEQTLFRRLSIFAGGFSVKAAQEVCSGKRLSETDIPGLIEALEAKSLLIADVRADHTSYRMLETVREYADWKLQNSPDKTALPAAHFAWCLDLAEKTERRLTGPDQLLALEQLEEANADLSRALERSLGGRRGEAALRLAGSLARFWALRGRFREGRDWLARALEAGLKAPGPVKAKALWGFGLLAGHLGDFDEAREAAERGLDEYRQSGDLQGRARSLTLLASLFLFRHPRHSLSLAEEGGALARQAGDKWCVAQSLRIGADAQMMLGATESSRSMFEECIEISRSAGDRATTAAGLIGLGWFNVIAARPAAAESALEQAFQLAQELNDPFHSAEALMFMGDMATARQDLSRAERLLDECRDVAHKIGSRRLIARSLSGLGRLAAVKGQSAQASEYFDQAISQARLAGLFYILIRTLQGKGSILLKQNDPETANALLGEALDLAREIGDKQGMCASLLTMGTIALRQGDDERAGTLYHEALLLSEQAEDHYRAMSSLRALGDLAAFQGRFTTAVRLFAAAHRLKHGGGLDDKMAAPCNCERLEAESVRHHLSREHFETAWEQGLSMSMAEAVAYTSRRRRTREDRPTTGWASLTRAEREVVDLLKEGLTNSEIAEKLYISSRTVGAHLSHIYSKLDLKSRKEVARQASLRSDLD